MFMVAPVIGSAYVPVQIRMIIVLALTMIIFPSLSYMGNIDPISVMGVLMLAQELVIGIAMGLILQLVFNAVTIAGENIAMTMGLGFAHLSDPVNGVSIPMVSQFLTITASMLFLSLGGHLAVVALLWNSFELLPIGTATLHEEYLQIVWWSGYMFSGAALIALPAVTALLIANIALGLMTRVAPQMNVFSIGFPLTLMIGFMMLMLTMPSSFQVFSKLLDQAYVFISTLLRV